MSGNLSFGQQVVVQLLGPVSATLVGTAILGGIGSLIARRLDRRREVRRLRENLLARVSKALYSPYYRVQHHERWVRHARPTKRTTKGASARLDDAFIEYRSELGALQNELDAYFGGMGPGQLLHQATDLLMVMYMVAASVPETQLNELIDKVAGKDHTGLDIAKLRDIDLVSATFAHSFRTLMSSIVETPLSNIDKFATSKILTGPDRWIGEELETQYGSVG